MSKPLKIEQVKKWAFYTDVAKNAALGGQAAATIMSVVTLSSLMTIPYCVAYVSLLYAKKYIMSKGAETIEGQRLSELYEHVVEEIIKLIHKLDLKTPLEVFSLLDYLNDINEIGLKNFFGINNTTLDIELGKEKAITGMGVCRHHAMLIDDIFKKLGFESSPVAGMVYSTSPALSHKDRMEDIKDIEQYLKETKKTKIIDETKQKEFQTLALKRNHDYNHIVNRVNFEGKSYIFDITNGLIFEQTELDNVYTSDYGRAFIQSDSGTNKFNKLRKIETVEELETIPIEEQTEIFNETQLRVRVDMEIIRDYIRATYKEIGEAQELGKQIFKK